MPKPLASARPTDLTPTRRRWPLRAADAQGLAQLGVDGTLGMTHLVEAMHQAVLSGGGLLPLAGHSSSAEGETSGITGGVYRAVRGTTRAVGWGLTGLLGLLARAGPASAGLAGLGEINPANVAPSSAEREALLAVLNGVLGDHLAATGNPLAISPGWRVGGQPLPAGGQGWAALLQASLGHTAGQATGHTTGRTTGHTTGHTTASTADQPLGEHAGQAASRVSGRVLVLVHGLCMNDLQFSHNGHNHGQVLAARHGGTPVYWHYNSGRHVADNGALLSQGLAQLLAHWPVPITELVLLGHSMGGLVLRSACHQAAQTERAAWLARTSHLFCLGTPHHGAPLERGGQLLDRALGLSPWVAPMARLGQVRSAGITDLRFGNVQPADGRSPASGGSRHGQRQDDRLPTPLPEGVFCGLVAATLSERAAGLRSATLGDGLVPLASALGRHRRPSMHLQVAAGRQQVVTNANHWDLLSRPEVARQLGDWLA